MIAAAAEARDLRAEDRPRAREIYEDGIRGGDAARPALRPVAEVVGA